MRILEFILILALLGAGYLLVRDDLAIRQQLGASAATASDLQRARDADVKSASAQQAECARDKARAVGEGIAIAKAAAVQTRAAPGVQPLVTADQIEAILP